MKTIGIYNSQLNIKLNGHPCELNEIQMMSSPSSETRSCLLCLQDFRVDHPGKAHLIEALCKSLRVPPSVISDDEQEYLQSCVYCKTCESHVEEAAAVIAKLEQLNQVLQGLARMLTDTLRRSFRIGQSHPAGRLRKSLIECCSKCIIQVSADERRLANEMLPQRAYLDEESAKEDSNRNLNCEIASSAQVSDTDCDAGCSIDVVEIPERRLLRPRGSRTMFLKDRMNPAARKSEGRKRQQMTRTCIRKNMSHGKSLPSFKCSECRKGFPTQQKRDVHYLKRHKGVLNPYECSKCNRKFEKPSKLLGHSKRWHADRQSQPATLDTSESSCPSAYPCSQCFMIFHSQDNLNAHIRRKHQGISNPYDCPQCDKQFRFRRQLQQHIQLHNQIVVKFPCDKCDKIFLSERKRLCHKAKTHCSKDNLLKFSCDKCSKTFSSVYALETHLYQHTGQRPFICEICGQSYCTKRRLQIHIKRHGTDPQAQDSFKCDQCEKVYLEGSSLMKHIMSVHEKKFRFRCEHCGAGAQSKSMLNRHMLCHTEDKKYSCQLCHMKFKRSPQLVQHMFIHEGKEPFVCKLCGKGFRASEKLKNHERLHTGEKPFTCDLCGKSFALKHYLTNHININHKGMGQKKRGKSEPQIRKGHSTVKVKVFDKEIAESPIPPATPAPVITFAVGSANRLGEPRESQRESNSTERADFIENISKTINESPSGKQNE